MTDDFIVPLLVLLSSGLLMYRYQLFHKKLVWHLSLNQIFHLVIAPGLLFPRIFSYIISLSQTPLSDQILISDSVLINLILLSIMYAYGGISIHSITKMLSYPEALRYDASHAGRLNRYFHLNFSHSLAYTGGFMAWVGMTLLELNHIPTTQPDRLLTSLLKGLLLGGLFLLTLRNYTKYQGDEYQGKWADLKSVFVVFWIGFMLLIYGINRIDGRLTDYQLLVPALISFALLGFLNLFLVVRWVNRRLKLTIRWNRLKRYFTT